MDNFTLEELNAMVVEAGETQVIVQANWIGLNASNEGVYYATDTDGDAGHIYINLHDGEYVINVASLITANDVITDYVPAATAPEDTE
tara:strand:+ start:381 stop:644 length:264 start_codon:yes stop_codon:yes gene_type:complete